MATDDETIVTIPPVRAFAGVEPDKAHALKPLEEAAEVFAAWQHAEDSGEHYTVPEIREISAHAFVECEVIVDECCDVIQATCNLLAALGVTDLTEAMADCERRNEERGRYGDR